MVAQIAEPIADVRPDSSTDMPAGLSRPERDAYVRGYARGCHTYVKKHGAPSVVLDGPAPAAGTPERRALAEQLREETTAHMIARQDTAHRAGMSALRKYRKTHGIETPAAPRTRKPAARKPRALAPVPDVDTAPPVADETPAPVVRLVPALDPEPAPVETDQDDTTDAPRVNRTRKLARRELAAAMRARGEDPTDAAAWAAAKLAAGVK